MAAWDGEKCVAELHCYRVALPDGRTEHRPECNDWWAEAAPAANLPLSGPAWCHTCFHVGRTLESLCQELLDKFILPRAQRENWDRKQIVAQLRIDVPNVSDDLAGSLVQEALTDQRRTLWDEWDLRYQGRGIGTMLCKESVSWARKHDYVAVLAPGAPDGLFEFAKWSGHLPWTTYAKLGFKVVNSPQEGDGLPDWAHDCPPPIMAEIQAVVAAGRPAHEINERQMVLDLRPQVGSAGK